MTSKEMDLISTIITSLVSGIALMDVLFPFEDPIEINKVGIVRMERQSLNDALICAQNLKEKCNEKAIYITLSKVSIEIWERSDKMKEMIDMHILEQKRNPKHEDGEIWNSIDSKFNHIYAKRSQFNNSPASINDMVDQLNACYYKAHSELQSRSSLVQLKKHIDLMGKRSMDIHMFCNSQISVSN